MKNLLGKFFLTALVFVQLSNSQTNKIIKSDKLDKAKREKIDGLFRERDKHGEPGAVIAISQNGELTYSKGYGYANLEYDIPNTPKTVFHVASISKQFTAFAIALLVDQGKLSLDDDIRTYLPYMPDYGHKIKIENLVHHTSGLRDQWNLLALAGQQSGDVVTEKRVLDLISNQQNLNFIPGKEFVYSNTNFTLLAKIVEQATGSTFADWTNDNIFDPLGMEKSFFRDDHETIVKNLAHSYQKEGDGYKKEVLNCDVAGATNFQTTVEDLVLWANNFKSIKVGNRAVMALMQQRGILNNGDTTAYAFGQAIDEYNGLKMVYHSGADAGYRTNLARFPSRDFNVTVLCNLASMDVEKLTKEIVDICLGTSEPNTEKAKETMKTDTEKGDFEIKNFKVYTGSFELMENVFLKTWFEDGILKGRITGKQDIHPFVPVSELEFKIPTLMATVKFDPDKDGLMFHKEGRSITANRVASFDIRSLDLRTFTGIYYSDELTTFYTLEIKKGLLWASVKGGPEIKLEPAGPDYFTGTEWFFKEVEFVRNPENNILAMKVSGKRARDFWFKKLENL